MTICRRQQGLFIAANHLNRRVFIYTLGFVPHPNLQLLNGSFIVERIFFMSTLVIHAPKGKEIHESKRSFENTIKTGIGDSYAIPQKHYSKIHPECKVIVLDKDRKLRAEGKLEKLVRSGKANNGIIRYDVYIKELCIVEYKPECLYRTGISVIEDIP